MPTFQAADGVTLSYSTWGDGPGRRLVVLHHGFIANSRTNWVLPGIVDALVAGGRRVAAIDARGHGESDKPHDPASYGEARMADDVIALVDLLGERTGYDLVGYSMGAIVSLIVATRDSRVRSVVASGVGSAVVEVGGVDTRAIGRDALRNALLADDPATVSPAATGFRAFVDAVGGDRVALAAQAAALHDTPIPLDTITVPALVLAGRDDHLATRPEVLADAIPGAVLRVVPGDHLGAVREPEFLRALTGFLNHPADTTNR
ncbi:alpha/beta fold hydrolase [Actinophytocola glycyrrhizae]|uniref:Alpha/beta fold hydrolase n=1 Tax=Actinophytocola glycyrrhizae TaxID=2044873 RepID=A0ABV9RS00_9PSEU